MSIPLSAPASARRLQRLDALASAGLRALSGHARLACRDGRIWLDGHLLPWTAPHLAGQPHDGLLARRALADAAALRQRFTDAAIHPQHAPDAREAPLARLFYEWFETFRVEALAPAHWPGVRHTGDAHFAAWSRRFHDDALIETQLGLLLFSASQAVRARLHRSAPDERFEDTMEATRAGLAGLIGPPLHAMTRHLREPGRFAPAARDLALRLARLVHEAQGEAFAAARRPSTSAFFLAFEPEPVGDTPMPVASPDARGRPRDASARYRVFTTAFDRQMPAATAMRAAVLDGHAQTLAQAWERLRLPVRRLARELAGLVQRPEPQGWDFDLDAGRLDGRQLARLVTRPGERHVFKQPAQAPHADAALALLIDCSGSMKQHAQAVALFASALNRMAALARVPLEVLGFGTVSWNGGRARAQWQRQHHPANPGRVADRLHLVFQSAAMRPVAARRGIAALLQADLYREGLDGEAVAWAGERLVRSGARRRILLVISDGCPSETATAQLNGPGYLAQHLCETVARQARAGTEVVGLGLGLDLRAFYPRSLPIEPQALPQTRTFAALWRLLATRWP